MGIIFGGVFLYLTLSNKPIDKIITSLSHANTGWMIISVVLLMLVFLLRSLRWKILIENAGGKARTGNVIYAMVMGYFVNSFTPKVGEVIRCTSLKKTNEVPVPLSLGTVVSERIYDLVVLVAGVLIILLIEINRLGDLFANTFSGLVQNINDHITFYLIIFIGFIISLIILFWILKKTGIYDKIKKFTSDIICTVKMTFKIKKYKIFILYTFLIWFTLGMLNYVFLLALPETNGFSIYFAFVVLFIGGIGWAIPSPGGIGTTHFFILQLFILFRQPEEAGVAYGVLTNGVTFVMTIVFGLMALGFSRTMFRKKITIDNQ